MSQNCFKKIIKKLVLLFLVQNTALFSTHNTSRYFPFLERPEDYILNNKSHITPSIFFSKASGADKRGGGECGVPELWGKYDLRDVIYSLREVEGQNFVNPIIEERGPNDSWIDKSIRYRVDGKIKAFGILLNYEQRFSKFPIEFGASIPVMHVHTSDRFSFLPEDSDSVFRNLRSGEKEQLERINRNTNDMLDLYAGDWNKTGFGDLDAHVRLHKNWDHTLKLKKIDLTLQTGLVCPTSSKYNNNYPSSVSFMGNGHWATYLDFVSEIELKQDWVFGFMFGVADQFSHSRNIRISTYKEPVIFSALSKNVKIEPGLTYKISPYIAALNLSDGLNVRLRYTYLRHDKDTWTDREKNNPVKSYLNQTTDFIYDGKNLTEKEIHDNKKEKENLSRWRSQYITLQFDYDSKEADNNWYLDPTLFGTLDYQFSGNGSCRTHQLTLGVELHF